MKFGHILRELREEKNISQVELARKLNITSQSLSQYELGKRMPDIEMIDRLANFFNVSVDYLLGRIDIREFNSYTPVQIKENDSNLDYLSEEIQDLSAESQEDLKKYLELLKIKDMQKRNIEVSDELSNTE